MEELVNVIAEILTERGQTLSTAESCTGGLIAHAITNLSGSSVYFMGGVVSYDNQVKQKVLHVPEAVLIEHGAVSEPVARYMAHNVRELMHTDYALSVTGIAGPGGGTAEKPVGLTYIGLASKDAADIVERYVWRGNRIANKNASASAALSLLIRVLQAND